MFNVPILFLIFNRPDLTKEVFKKIREVKPKHLFIAADGPRDGIGEWGKCEEARNIVHEIDWECNIQTLFRETNLGCRVAVSSAIDWFFDHVEEGIILEDDCLPDLSFFYFCEVMLERYKDDNRIISINGCNFGFKGEQESTYFFTKFMNMWGWATWRRSANEIDYRMKKWGAINNKYLFLYRRLIVNLSKFDWMWIKYWYNAFGNTYNEKKDTWDYQWIFRALTDEKLSIVPSVNLVKNLGFNDSSTHIRNSALPPSTFNVYQLQFPIIHPKKVYLDPDFEENYVKRIWCNYNPESLINQIRHFRYSLFNEIL